MTHAELVKRIGRWLRGVQKCPVVLEEIGSASEQPDVIAWRWGTYSTLVECKVSRADFLHDADKYFRKVPERGMGVLRYYAAPPGLLKPAEMPGKWGLIEVGPRSCRVIVKAEPHYEYHWRNEMILLTSAIRRATEGWSRKVFGELAPPLVDGDPHPTAARVIKDLRAENRRLVAELKRR